MRQIIATLRRCPASLIGIFLALVATSTVITWVFSLGEAGSTRAPTERLAGTAVVVVGNLNVIVTTGRGQNATTDGFALTSYRRVPTSLVSTISTIPGIKTVVADRSTPLALQLPNGQVDTGTGAGPITGYGWQSAALTPFALRFGHAPAGANQLVIGAGLASRAGLRIGSHIKLEGQRLRPFTVVGIADGPAGDPATNWAVFFSGSEAAALYGHPGQSDLIGIVARPGISPTVLAQRVRAALRDEHLSVLSGSARGAAENLTAAAEVANLRSFGSAGIIFVYVSLFVVAGTIALSVAERARSLALLRAIGATPGQVRRMIMVELAVLGLLGGLAGYLPGIWLASFSIRGLAAHGLVPASARSWTSLWELLPSVFVGVVIAQLSGLFAARRAARAQPTTALYEASIERRSPRSLRLVLGLGALGSGLVYSVTVLHQPDPSQQVIDAQLVLLIFMAGVALLGPYLMTLAEFVSRLALRWIGGTPGRLASAQIRSRTRRMAASSVAIALPVAFIGAILTIDATQIHGSDTESRQRLAASAVVTASGPGLDSSVLTAIKQQAQVTQAIGLAPTIVYVPNLNASAEGVTPGSINSALHLDVVSGSLAHFCSGDMAVSELIGGKGGMNAHVGEMTTAYLADGTPYRAKVTAIYARSLGFADVLVPMNAAGGGHLGTTTLGEVLVDGQSGSNPALLPKELAALSRSYPGLEVATRSVANAQDELLNSQTSYANDLLLILLGLLVSVALVNTLVMATLQGRYELVLLQRVGATHRQLFAMAAWEAGLVTIVGVLVGIAEAAAAVIAVAKALTGSPTPSISWASVAVVLGLVVVLTGLAAFAPTARMLASNREA